MHLTASITPLMGYAVFLRIHAEDSSPEAWKWILVNVTKSEWELIGLGWS